ncbi:hypothetical protein HDU76_003999 [Blyttiomyces sp. JEL0837]|nr:hypothetical protein HDU76_003999 [Blyttiomyces sp. JEL0837]
MTIDDVSKDDEQSIDMNMKRVENLIQKVSDTYAEPVLQSKFFDHWHSKATSPDEVSKANDPANPPGVHSVVAGTEKLGIRNVCRFYHVESDYYDWTLEKRMMRLLAPSTAHLCKTLIFENSRHLQTGDMLAEPTNSKYYAVIVQYIGKLNTQKLMNLVRDLNGKTVSKKNYNMRVTAEENSLQLTGYDTGGVSPFGMATPNIPIILSKAITTLQPQIFFLGAGHVDWKIGVPVKEFMDATKCYVADLE